MRRVARERTASTVAVRVARLTLLALILSFLFAYVGQTSTANAQVDHRYVVLIQGLTSVGVPDDCISTPVDDPFLVWRSSVQNALDISENQIRAVSYAGTYCPGEEFRLPTYTALQTCDGIATVVTEISGLLNSVLLDDPDAEFYIIGHSLGGFVAAYWVSQETDGALAPIGRVFTLDSPLGDVPAIPFVTRPLLEELFEMCQEDPNDETSWHDSTFRILEGQPDVKFYSDAVEDPQLTTERVQFVNLYCGRPLCLGGPLSVTFPVTMVGAFRAHEIRGSLEDGGALEHSSIKHHQDTLTGTALFFNFSCDRSRNQGAPLSADVTVAAGNGLSAINYVASNLTVDIPPFGVGTTDPVVVTVTQVEESLGGSLELELVDVKGNLASCDHGSGPTRAGAQGLRWL